MLLLLISSCSIVGRVLGWSGNLEDGLSWDFDLVLCSLSIHLSHKTQTDLIAILIDHGVLRDRMHFPVIMVQWDGIALRGREGSLE